MKTIIVALSVMFTASAFADNMADLQSAQQDYTIRQQQAGVAYVVQNQQMSTELQSRQMRILSQQIADLKNQQQYQPQYQQPQYQQYQPQYQAQAVPQFDSRPRYSPQVQQEESVAAPDPDQQPIEPAQSAAAKAEYNSAPTPLQPSYSGDTSLLAPSAPVQQPTYYRGQQQRPLIQVNYVPQQRSGYVSVGYTPTRVVYGQYQQPQYMPRYQPRPVAVVQYVKPNGQPNGDGRYNSGNYKVIY